jgi:hypothetical protein
MFLIVMGNRDNGLAFFLEASFKKEKLLMGQADGIEPVDRINDLMGGEG